MANTVADSPSGPLESAYIAPNDLPLETITQSLQRLLSTRHLPLTRRRFTVLDTFDSRVRRAGASLTRADADRTSTVTWFPACGGTHLIARSTQPVNFAWDLPSGPLQEVLARVIGVRRLLPQADAEEYGSLLEVLDDHGKTVARIRIESGHARSPLSHGSWQLLPTMVTLCGLRGYETVYGRLVPVIESRPGMRTATEDRHGAILRKVGVFSRTGLSSLRVDLATTVTAEAGARQIHLALLRILVANEPGIRANIDSEFLHDYRVAVRRTRSLLRQIRHIFPAEAVARFSDEFSWIGRITGPLRDNDVLVLALRAHQGDFPADDVEAVLAFLGQAHAKEHVQLVKALDSDRYQQLLAGWQRFLSGPVARDPDIRDAHRPLVDAVSRRAWRLSQRIADVAATIDEHTSAERLHAVRLVAKKLRYLIDATPGFYDRADLEYVLGTLKKLQRVLGDFNDAHVQERSLIECGRALGARGGPAGALFVLGRLVEQARHRRETLRGDLAERLTQFSSRETQTACRRAFRKTRRERLQ